MALSDDEYQAVRTIVETSLEDAEKVWARHGHFFEDSAAMSRSGMLAKAEIVPSRIPDHPTVSRDNPTVGDYVCLVADMRDSSKHLLQAYAGSTHDMSLMKRVYFETAALLPALDLTIGFGDGQVTEYLGDGVLALVAASADEREEAIKRSYRTARNCIGDARDIVNEALERRYKLPSLDLGVGLAFSSAIVQLVGVPGQMHAKAIGPCVYYATKLSGGRNEIYAHENLRKIWPSSKGGGLQFQLRKLRGTDGYLVGRSK